VITDDQIRALRRRAHVHVDHCYGRYEPCGEHHVHDDQCGGRPLVCGLPAEPDLVLLLDEVERLRSELTKFDAEGARAFCGMMKLRDDAVAEVDRMRPVYEAAKTWRQRAGNANHADEMLPVIRAAVDAALAREAKDPK
jgi:hypothetical protein